MRKNISLFNFCTRGIAAVFIILFTSAAVFSQTSENKEGNSQRRKVSINNNWCFFKYNSPGEADSLIYDVRPEVKNVKDDKPADTRASESGNVKSGKYVLKPWVLPTGNYFIKDSSRHHVRPEGNPGSGFLFVKKDFNDSSWEHVNLPHDWAVKGPFYEGSEPEVGGGMGRLPSPGVAWYRKKLDIPVSDSGKSIFLDIDGAMSYAIVWLNGKLVGGWPYGYSSFRLDLTPYAVPGSENQLAIRIDNPNYSSRWYPGGGLYRNVWLVKTSPVHVGQWGTFITTHNISSSSADADIEITVNNDGDNSADIKIVTEIYELDEKGNSPGKASAVSGSVSVNIKPGGEARVKNSVTINNPRLWGPAPTQTPNRYLAITSLFRDGKVIDEYKTAFGIRSVRFDPDSGVYINGELIKLKGVDQHHDLGALGAAFNTRAAERQLEILKEMGCNAIRMSHNPPAPELLELTDRMGFLVMDESFDVWERGKNPHDFHLIFNDWYEQDLRAMVRRDRNSPSIIIWSFGNEVGEQYTGEEGAALAKKLRDIIKEEDPTRPSTTAMNWAKPDMPLPAVLDVISLNYQGEGIRQEPMFEGTERIRTAPQYDPYHKKFPDKVILSSETASAASSRGVYLFPVTPEISSPIRDGMGGDSKIKHVSSYELYAVDFGSSADKVFRAIDSHPFVAGEFVWNGFDYIGEPTPYYDARSSYTGIIDLAGFKKDRFYLYQAHWRPELPMAHILPHWNWPDRGGKVTPVHVFTSGDEVELFLNNKSLGKKKKDKYEYRLRWDDVIYEPGELKAVAYRNGQKWAEDIVKTTDVPAGLFISADRSEIKADGKDLSFITVRITDKNGLTVPVAMNNIKFEIDGPAEIIGTDNGDPTNFTPFTSPIRDAFNGLLLVIIRSLPGKEGTVKVSAKSEGLQQTEIVINTVK